MGLLLQQGSLLRHFLVVANERSVSAAARALSISQPALTRSIRRLEADFGVALFERRPRGMALTPFGEALFRHAQRIATEIQFAEAEMAAFREGGAGRLRVGAGPFWGATIVPAAIARLQQRFTRLAVHLDVGVNGVIVPKLLDGEIDCVFGAIPEADALPPFILRREFLNNEIRVVAAADHPLLAETPAPARARRGTLRSSTSGATVTARALSRYPWVVYQEDRDVIVRLLDAMQAAGAPPPMIRVESTSMSALIALLKAGPYLACVSEALIAAQPDLGIRVVPSPLSIWRFPTGMLLHRSLEHHAPAGVLATLVYEQTARFRNGAGSPARSPRRP